MTNSVAGRAGLIEVLSWARPHDSETEKRFCREFLDTVPGMTQDFFGNRILSIGRCPNVLWSCHVDTVAAKDGPQLVAFDPETGMASLAAGKPGMSLGADDGAGLWIMLAMIEAGKPGLYVFHRGEEQGCLGSRWIRDNTPELLAGIQAAIAFDRAGYSDVITHQASGRTCSDAFAESMAAALNVLDADFRYEPDDTGIYTDTNEYARLVPECTNLSVGYFGQHGPRETLDVLHCEKLLDAILQLDTGLLKIERDPAMSDPDDDWGRWLKPTRRRRKEAEDYANAVADHPEIAAKVLASLGVDLNDFLFEVWDHETGLSEDYRPLAAA